MGNEYKEWLKDQTFDTLVKDNLRVKLELQTAKEENEKLTQQNKQMKEALDKIINTNINEFAFIESPYRSMIDGIKDIAQQALKGVE